MGELIVRLARENRRWGYLRIKGELAKLGVTVSATTVRNVLRRHGLGPAGHRDGLSWKEFIRHQAAGIVACDFFTVETVALRRLYVLFFLDMGSRRVRLAGITDNPNGTWVTQQARNLVLASGPQAPRVVIRARPTIPLKGAETPSLRAASCERCGDNLQLRTAGDAFASPATSRVPKHNQLSQGAT